MKSNFEIQEKQIDVSGRDVRSLIWNRDQLVDWVGGGQTFHLDGTHTISKINWAFPFDDAMCSPSNRFTVIYQRLGTKALLLDRGKIIRELNRSYYCATDYEYPIALFALSNGREIIAHCPDKYNKIEIEELETGKRLTVRDNEPEDFFHSRLAINSTGTKLLNAGWMWHPFDFLTYYDLEEVLLHPQILDHSQDFNSIDKSAEINSAVFLTPTSIALASAPDAEDFNDGQPKENRMTPGTIGVFDLTQNQYSSLAPLTETVGTMMAIDAEHVIGFYEHPKLIHTPTGRILHRWPNIDSGRQNSSIIGDIHEIPPMAFDHSNQRFAVAGKESITVVKLKN